MVVDLWEDYKKHKEQSEDCYLIPNTLRDNLGNLGINITDALLYSIIFDLQQNKNTITMKDVIIAINSEEEEFKERDFKDSVKRLLSINILKRVYDGYRATQYIDMDSGRGV